MRRTVLATAALAALIAGCTPTGAPGPTSSPEPAATTTPDAEPVTPSESPSPGATETEGETPAFAPEDIVDARGVLFLTEMPDGLTEGDGYPDQSGWRVIAEGTCTLSVREVPLSLSGGEPPVYMQEQSQELLLATAEDFGLEFEPLDVADLPLANGRTESGETLFAEARAESPNGTFEQFASRVTVVTVEGSQDTAVGAELHYSCPTEDDYAETWPDVAGALEVGVWTSDLWWGGN